MLDNLNPAQLKAVQHSKGPLLVIAGAGSGKTRVITRRVARLINEEGVEPYNILALTFTNKASSEMKERIESLLENTGLDLWVSTFHSACVRILRRGIGRLGYTTDFVIYDALDQKALIKNCIEELGLSEEKFSPIAIANKISTMKNNLRKSDNNPSDDEYNTHDAVMRSIFPLYHEKLKTNNALDFDDLQLLTVKLFKSEPDILAYYQNRFQYLLVDEYQDTNYVQYKLIQLLAREHQNICVVGDEDQSIYRWRGADIDNILSFEKNFKNTLVIKLEENYRSTKVILEASNHVISKNLQRKGKTLFTSNEEGEKITYYRASNEMDEGNFICNAIKDSYGSGKINFSDVSVFYRTNAQSRVIEECMRKASIPYQIIGGLKFYARKEIKDIIAYCRIIINPADSVNLKRIFSTNMHGIGKVSQGKINDFARENHMTSCQAMMEMGNNSSFSGAVKKKIKRFCDLLNKLKAFAEINSISEVIRYIQSETGYVDKLMDENSFEARNRIENLKELITAAESFEKDNDPASVKDFLDQIALVSDIDGLDETQGTASLMTLHNSKGLEFPFVFITGMEKRLFPHIRSMDSMEEMEEERRLCYVGMTRAKNRLFLLNAVTRKIYGMEQTNPPSDFIEDIPDKLMEKILSSKQEHTLVPQSRFSLKKGPSKKDDSKFPIGTKVAHETFGDGVILNKSGSDDDEILDIFFKRKGKKKLKAKYANLKVL